MPDLQVLVHTLMTFNKVHFGIGGLFFARCFLFCFDAVANFTRLSNSATKSGKRSTVRISKCFHFFVSTTPKRIVMEHVREQDLIGPLTLLFTLLQPLPNRSNFHHFYFNLQFFDKKRDPLARTLKLQKRTVNSAIHGNSFQISFPFARIVLKKYVAYTRWERENDKQAGIRRRHPSNLRDSGSWPDDACSAILIAASN